MLHASKQSHSNTLNVKYTHETDKQYKMQFNAIELISKSVIKCIILEY